VPDPKPPRWPRPQDPENRPVQAEPPQERPEKASRPPASLGQTTLTGQLLIAMPQMQDPRFARTVIYLCAHGSEGAMGLVVNKFLDNPPVTLSKLMSQLGIAAEGLKADPRVHRGGPVEEGRGFVLHSADYTEEATLVVGNNVALTATLDILLALGYAGWGPGQLDAEMQANGWLHVGADDTLVFDPNAKDKWQQALAKIGVDLTALSGDAGHA
jgi:putative transcriptional regulator